MAHIALFKKLVPEAKLPEYATLGAIGADIFAIEDVTVKFGFPARVGTGVSVAFPDGYYLRAAPKSGLAMKGLDVGAGVIDIDYRGEIGIILYNHSQTPITIEKGQKVAQIIFEKAARLTIQEVEELPGVGWSHSGWGSTGK